MMGAYVCVKCKSNPYNKASVIKNSVVQQASSNEGRGAILRKERMMHTNIRMATGRQQHR